MLLSLADRLATRGLRARPRPARPPEADEKLTLLEELRRDRAAAAARRRDRRAHGRVGQRIAELVEALAEEQAAGTVTTREEAVALVRG